MPFATIGEVELFYTDEGGGGPPMLFVHGYTGDSHDWLWQLGHFGETHRVIAADLRGHGRSSVPAGGFEPKVFADDLAGLLRHLDCGPVVAVGHSLGGLVVSALAVEYPELVTALVCVDPAYLVGDDLNATIEPMLSTLEADPVPVIQSLIGRSISPEFRHHATWHRRRIAGTPEHVLIQTIRNLLELSGRATSEPYLRRRTPPVLTIYATPDRVPIETALFTDERSRAISWAGVGHFLQAERPDEFNSTVDAWLAELGAGALPPS